MGTPKGKPEMFTGIEDSDSLIHYTSAAGLAGILRSQTLWASHYAYLNDQQEIHTAREVMVEVFAKSLHSLFAKIKVDGTVDGILVDISPSTDLRQLATKAAEKYISVIHTVMLKYLDPYILSFYLCSPDNNSSEYRNGSLRHWTSYGKSGGFAIEFGAKSIANACEQESNKFNHSGFHLIPVEYDLDLQKAERTPQVKEINECLRHISKSQILESQPDEEVVRSSLLPYTMIASGIKNRHFQDEREARIVVYRPSSSDTYPSDSKVHPVHFRDTGGLHTPYIELFKQEEPKLPVTRVLVGPHPENELRVKSLELMLAELGREEISIEVSNIPYIDR